MNAHSPCPDHGPLGRLRAKRRSLLFSCAIGSTLALAAYGEQAKAQAFQADPVTIAGGVLYNRATPGIETITVTSDSAIINWEPNVPGNPIPFLPAGNVATFQNGPSNSDFVVLNRITAIDPVRFDGTVLGRLQSGGSATPGGTILFSSPGGIIVGAGALFDVGSLVLTTLNVVDDGAGNFITPGGGFEFNLGSDFPNAAIITEAGSQIVASPENSYVALVAPVIGHGGSVSVNGSAAYIAGEELEFTVNQGLFDIIVTTGSDNPTPITHAASASTGGPASTGGTDNHAIYMVAVPKNQAIQMLLEGSVGFQPAVSASIENGVVILSSGWRHRHLIRISRRAQDATSSLPWRFTSDVNGRVDRIPGDGGQRSRLCRRSPMRGGSVASWARPAADRSAVISPLPPPPLRTRRHWRRAAVFADPGSSVTVTGDALVDASGLRDRRSGAVGNSTGGTARVTADGTIAFGQSRTARDRRGAAACRPRTRGFGQGGNIAHRRKAASACRQPAGRSERHRQRSNAAFPAPGAGHRWGRAGLADKRRHHNHWFEPAHVARRGGDVEDGTGTGGEARGGNVDVGAEMAMSISAPPGVQCQRIWQAGPDQRGTGGNAVRRSRSGRPRGDLRSTLGTGGSSALRPEKWWRRAGGIVELRARVGADGSQIRGTLHILTQGSGMAWRQPAGRRRGVRRPGGSAILVAGTGGQSRLGRAGSGEGVAAPGGAIPGRSSRVCRRRFGATSPSGPRPVGRPGPPANARFCRSRPQAFGWRRRVGRHRPVA